MWSLYRNSHSFGDIHLHLYYFLKCRDGLMNLSDCHCYGLREETLRFSLLLGFIIVRYNFHNLKHFSYIFISIFLGYGIRIKFAIFPLLWWVDTFQSNTVSWQYQQMCIPKRLEHEILLDQRKSIPKHRS